MMEEDKDEFYYITAMNENYAQPSMPAGVEDDIVRGMYRFARMARRNAAGLFAFWARARSCRRLSKPQMLEAEWGVASEVWSATSYSELAATRGRPNASTDSIRSRRRSVSHLAACLPGAAPIIAASDYVRAYPQMIAAYVEARFIALGTDGFGRAIRAGAARLLRSRPISLVIAALDALASEGVIAPDVVASAIERYNLKRSAPPPWSI